MNWNKFETYDLGYQKAFEALCNQIFEAWINKNQTNISYFTTVRGDGGDGGVESFAELDNGEIISLQAKWFRERLTATQIRQIRNSIKTGLRIRPRTKIYIVAIPKDLTSIRIGRGLKKTKVTEQKLWLQLCKEIKKAHPKLNLVLWNDHKLTSLLSMDILEGVKKFWFDKEQISLDTLKLEFEKSKASWLNGKYSHNLHTSLHTSGYMQSILPYFLRSLRAKNEVINGYNRITASVNKVKSEISYIEKMCNDRNIQEFMTLKEYLNSIIKYIDINKEKLINNYELLEQEISSRPSYGDIDNFIKRLIKENKISDFNDDFIKSYGRLSDIEPERYLNAVLREWNSKSKIFLGNRSTGKTHALAYITEVLLKNDPPIILIQAKDINDHSSWKSILHQALGLGTDWDEAEIFKALEALAHMSVINNTYSDKNKRSPTFLILIDGLDETKNWDSWQNRIKQTVILSERFNRVRFISVARPYFIEDSDFEKEFGGTIDHLPPEGDVPVNELIPKYMKEFKINIAKAPWIIFSLKSPFILRLFCETYSNKTIEGKDKIEYTLAGLLRQKILRIEKIIDQDIKPHSLGKDTLIKCLSSMSEYFYTDDDICHEELIKLIKKVITLDDGLINRIIEYLLNNGIIFSFYKNAVSLRNPGTTYYQPTQRSIIEFFLAMELAEKVNQGQATPPSHLKYREIISIASTILFNDYNKLPGDDNLWVNDIEQRRLDTLRCVALSNAEPDKTANYEKWVSEYFMRDMPSSRFILTHLFFKVADIPNHPLGPKLIHKLLSSYHKTSDRDLIWSGLEYIPNNHGAIWEGNGPNQIKDLSYRLSKYHKYDGLPLLYAWNLASIDNYVVDKCSRELVKWGYSNPNEFLKLLDLVYPTNDPQIAEMLMCCASGLVSVLSLNNRKNIKDLALWTIKSIFANVDENRNVIIRGSGRKIVERAYQYKLITSEQVKLARPPFKIDFKILNINHDAAKTDSESYGPIYHDLAWYVIKEAYEPFFHHYHEETNTEIKNKSDLSKQNESELRYLLSGRLAKLNRAGRQRILYALKEKNRIVSKYKRMINPIKDDELHKLFMETLASNPEENKPKDVYFNDAEDVLKKYVSAIGFNVSPHQLTIGFIYQYLLDLGWNEDQFRGKPNGGKEGEILGADFAVMRQHWMSDHGKRSPIMSFAEKYIWTAIHYLQGYFSDYIKYSDYPEGRFCVTDYSELEHIPNPAQEVYSQDVDNNYWVPHENLSPDVQIIKGDLKRSISHWVDKSKIPNFLKIIEPNIEETRPLKIENPLLQLHSFISQLDSSRLGYSLLWLNCFLIKNKDLVIFERDLKKQNIILGKIISELPTGTKTGVKCRFYESPRDVVWMRWKEEIESTISYNTIKNGDIGCVDLYKTICGVYTRSVHEIEKELYLPSKIVMDGIGIVSGNGYEFIDEKDDIVAICNTAGDSFRDYQDTLYIEKKRFIAFCKNKGFIPIWFLRFDRRQSTSTFHSIGRVGKNVTYKYIFYYKGKKLKKFDFPRLITN